MKETNCKDNDRRKVPFYRSIRMRLTCSFLVPVVCILALGVCSYQKASKALIDSYKTSAVQTAGMIEQYMDFLITSEKNDFKTYIGAEDMITYVRQLGDTSELSPIRTDYLTQIRSMINQDENLSKVYFLLDGGRSMVDNTTSVPDDAYTAYRGTTQGAAVIEDGFSWFLFGQDAEADAALNLDTDSYSLRIARRLKKLSCVMIIDLSQTAIREVLGSLDAGADGSVSLVTESGSEFFASDNSALAVCGTQFYDRAASSESAEGTESVTVNGEEYLFVYSRSDTYGFMITAMIPKDEMLSGTADIKKLSFTLTLVSILVAMLLGALISGQMSGTIRYILRQLDKVAKGNLSISLKSKNRDEFGMLCEGINDMIANMKQLLVHVNEVSAELNDAAGYVGETYDTFLQTSHDIQKIVSELEVGVNKLDSGSEDCLSQMDSLSGKITNVSANADEIGKLTTETGTTISSGMVSVQGLTESARSTTQITQNVITSIVELEDMSNAIHKIIQDINEIAEQTNLLSLNASIEAARAGDSGRGFAVVAEEIRKLSDQCQGSAGKIAEIVTKIADKTQEVVSIAKKAEDVVGSQTQAVALTTDSFRMIDKQVASLLNALGTISATVEEMGSSRSETLEAIESISAVSAQTAACTSSVYDTAGTQLAAIKNLEDASAQLRSRSERLVELMGTFQV